MPNKTNYPQSAKEGLHYGYLIEGLGNPAAQKKRKDYHPYRRR